MTAFYGGERRCYVSAKLKKILSFLLIVASIAAVVFIAFSNTELKDAWGAISGLDLRWVAGLFGCCTFFDGMNYWCYLRREKFKSVSAGRLMWR